MHITIDNIFAFLILVLILVTFMGYIIPSAYLSFTTTKEHQLEEVAQAIMDKILLSPGHPEEWGDISIVESEEDLRAFGLQKTNGSVYELDVNKLLRIASVNTSLTMTLPWTIRISQETIARLLGLGNDYGFSIRVTPALNLSVRSLGTYTFTKGNGKGHGKLTVPNPVEVTVTTPDGRPALGANVTGLFTLMSIRSYGSKEECYVNASFVTSVVNWEGKATLDFTSFLDSINNELKNKVLKKSGSTIIIYADYYGIRAVNSSILETDVDEILRGTVVDNYLILEHAEELEFPGPPAAVHLGKEAALANPPYYVYLSDFEDVTEHGESGWIINHGHYNIRVYELSSVVDDDVVLIMMPAKYTGQYYLVSFFREPSNVICQKGAASGNIKTSVLRRMVRVGSFHYFVEVRVWRWGEG
jgi:hypothetical protein